MIKLILIFSLIFITFLYFYLTPTPTPTPTPTNQKIAPRFFNTFAIFPHLKDVAKNWQIIQQEMDSVKVNGDWKPWPEKNLWDKPGDSWTTYPIQTLGVWTDSKCPKTTEMLKKIPGLVNAGFSCLGPKTELNPHQGWADISNHILRTHLGLQVPEPNKCGIWVEGEYKYIDDGTWITFDDSKTHSGFNHTTKDDRIVLILDIKRPAHIPKGKSQVKKTPQLFKYLQQINEST